MSSSSKSSELICINSLAPYDQEDMYQAVKWAHMIGCININRCPPPPGSHSVWKGAVWHSKLRLKMQLSGCEANAAKEKFKKSESRCLEICY